MIALCYALMGLISLGLIAGTAGMAYTIHLIIKDVEQIEESYWYDSERR